MKFADILKVAANVGSGIFIGLRPPFADSPKLQDLPALVPNNTSNKIAAAIATVEHLTTTIDAMKTLSGPDKLAAATALAKDSILMSSALAGSKVKDQARFDKGCSDIVSGWNDVLKSLETN